MRMCCAIYRRLPTPSREYRLRGTSPILSLPPRSRVFLIGAQAESSQIIRCVLKIDCAQDVVGCVLGSSLFRPQPTDFRSRRFVDLDQAVALAVRHWCIRKHVVTTGSFRATSRPFAQDREAVEHHRTCQVVPLLGLNAFVTTCRESFGIVFLKRINRMLKVC